MAQKYLQIGYCFCHRLIELSTSSDQIKTVKMKLCDYPSCASPHNYVLNHFFIHITTSYLKKKLFTSLYIIHHIMYISLTILLSVFVNHNDYTVTQKCNQRLSEEHVTKS